LLKPDYDRTFLHRNAASAARVDLHCERGPHVLNLAIGQQHEESNSLLLRHAQADLAFLKDKLFNGAIPVPVPTCVRIPAHVHDSKTRSGNCRASRAVRSLRRSVRDCNDSEEQDGKRSAAGSKMLVAA
jgi:hypothetical protein